MLIRLAALPDARFNGLISGAAPLRAAPARLLLGDSGLCDEEEEMLLLLPATRPIRAALAGRRRSQQVRELQKKTHSAFARRKRHAGKSITIRLSL